MAISDYTGRSVDLFIMRGAEATGSQLITTDLDWDNGGKITTGIQKAAQFFLTAFLTAKGSRMYSPEFGTNFLTRVRSANMNDARLKNVFSEAAEDILNQQDRYRTTAAEDDELLSRIELVSFANASPTEMSLTVELTTRAGTTRKVILPVSLALK